MKKISIILILVGLVIPTILVVKSIQFTQNCGGYLIQTADANSVELASERLDMALDYIEKHGLTEGYTSVLWKTEDENIAFWYQNLKVCQKELTDATNASQLEKTNVLMKVRESLTDQGEKGTKLTIPYGISRYPHNALYGWLLLFSILIVIAGVVILFIELDL